MQVSQKNKALILDRDGTINVDKHYLINSADFEFEKFVPEILKSAYQNDYLLIVITNQSGVARGYFTEKAVIELHEFIQQQSKNHGFEFAEFFYCPHHKNGKIQEYAYECNCRKPKTMLLENAIKKYNIDIDRSFVIGDKDADILLGQAVGIKTVLVGTGYGQKYKNSKLNYDYFIEDFSGLPEIIGVAGAIQKSGGV
jgi:D-glycero-D-manno-heptose 1,7-bisphosphate phosphatase